MQHETAARPANAPGVAPRPKGEILPLTSLRAWAALLVVAHHDLVHYHHSVMVAGRSIPIKPGNGEVPWHVAIMSEARVGVTLFFVLSGFLLALRYWNSRLDVPALKTFFVKRVARIWPLYLAVCGLQFAFEVYKGHGNLVAYASYFTLTQGFFDEIKFYGVSTAWSLTVEECFYLLLPAILLAFRGVGGGDRAGGWRWWGGRLLILAAATGALAALGRALSIQPWFKLWGFFEGSNGHWVGYTICGRFFDFAAGIFAAMVYLRTSNRLLANPAFATAGFALGAGLLLGGMQYSFYHPFDGLFPNEPYHPLFVVASALIVYFLCAPDSAIARAFSARWMVYLGKVSFALYLLHAVDFIVPVYRRVFLLGLSEFAEGVACALIAIAASIAAYEFVEKPGQRAVLRWWKARGGDVPEPIAEDEAKPLVAPRETAA